MMKYTVGLMPVHHWTSIWWLANNDSLLTWILLQMILSSQILLKDVCLHEQQLYQEVSQHTLWGQQAFCKRMVRRSILFCSEIWNDTNTYMSSWKLSELVHAASSPGIYFPYALISWNTLYWGGGGLAEENECMTNTTVYWKDIGMLLFIQHAGRHLHCHIFLSDSFSYHQSQA